MTDHSHLTRYVESNSEAYADRFIRFDTSKCESQTTFNAVLVEFDELASTYTNGSPFVF